MRNSLKWLATQEMTFKWIARHTQAPSTSFKGLKCCDIRSPHSLGAAAPIRQTANSRSCASAAAAPQRTAGSSAPPASRRMPPLLRKRFSSSDLELTERLLSVRENALELDDGRPAFLKTALGKASFACPGDPAVEAVRDPHVFRTHPVRLDFVCMDDRGGRSGARGIWIGMLGWARCWWTFST